MNVSQVLLIPRLNLPQMVVPCPILFYSRRWKRIQLKMGTFLFVKSAGNPHETSLRDFLVIIHLCKPYGLPTPRPELRTPFVRVGRFVFSNIRAKISRSHAPNSHCRRMPRTSAQGHLPKSCAVSQRLCAGISRPLFRTSFLRQARLSPRAKCVPKSAGRSAR